MGVPSKWEPQQSSQVAEKEVLGSQLGGGGGSEWPDGGVNRGCETWMGGPVLLRFSPAQFFEAGLQPGSLPPHLTLPLCYLWMGGGVNWG